MKKMKTFAYRILSIMGSLMAFMLVGCVKNEFKVDFEFPKEHIGNYMMTYYAWDSRGGRGIEHTVSIQEGKAAADCITRLPTLIYISDASQPGSSMMVYAERGDEIKISGEGTDMASWTVTGNKLSERWSAWRKGAYPKKKDIKTFHKSIEEYVKGNPKDELSAILLLTEWNRREDPEGFVRLWNMIDKDSRSQQLIDICGATDFLGVEFITNADGKLEYAKDSKINILPLRTRDRGLDTLKLNKPSFLYFFGENNAARRETADSLRILLRAYPDSTKSVVADVYMDSDSLTWVNAIRRDSLDGMTRAWQPRGLAEGLMVRLGVRRLPWFVVKDKDAKEAYAGSDIKEATAAFRKLMGKPDPKAAKAEKDNDMEKGKQKTEVKTAPDSRQKAIKNRKPKPLPNQSLKPQKKLKIDNAD